MYPTCIGHCRCGCWCWCWLWSTGKLAPLSTCNILILTLLRLVRWWRSRSLCWWWSNLDSTWRRWQTCDCTGTLFGFGWNLTAIFFLSNKYVEIWFQDVAEIVCQNIKHLILSRQSFSILIHTTLHDSKKDNRKQKKKKFFSY